MTELTKLFVATGFLADTRPASMLLVAEQGTGKTELQDRFRPVVTLSYQSDLTMRGLLPLLRRARTGSLSHLAMTELQKLFLRKAAVAENCFGLLLQAMEEGVWEVSIGGAAKQYGGARLGLIASITPGSFRKRLEYFDDTGFLSRAALLVWEPPDEEIKEVMRRMATGDRRDLEPVHLTPPSAPVKVQIPKGIALRVKDYAWAVWQERGLRHLTRLLALTKAAAYLAHRRTVTLDDWGWVLSFDDYWRRSADV